MRYMFLLLKTICCILLLGVMGGCSTYSVRTSLLPQADNGWITDSPIAKAAGYSIWSDATHFHGNGAIFSCGDNTLIVHSIPVQENISFLGPPGVPLIPFPGFGSNIDIGDYPIYGCDDDPNDYRYEDQVAREYYSKNLNFLVELKGENARTDLKNLVELSVGDNIYKPLDVIEYKCYRRHPSYFVIFDLPINKVEEFVLDFEEIWENCAIKKVKFVKTRIQTYDALTLGE